MCLEQVSYFKIQQLKSRTCEKQHSFDIVMVLFTFMNKIAANVMGEINQINYCSILKKYQVKLHTVFCQIIIIIVFKNVIYPKKWFSNTFKRF